MRMIYVDESARSNRFYFFGGLIADGAAIRSVEEGFDSIARLVAGNVSSFSADTEFHAVDMFHGDNGWKDVPVAWRVKACDLVAKVISRSSAKFVFRGIDLVALQARYSAPYPAHELTLAQLLEVIDEQVGLLDTPEKIGIVHADDHHSANNARRSLKNFRLNSVSGYTTRRLEHIADTIYFGPSHESRLLQASDFATYFLNRTRTITESDSRAEAAIEKIVSNIRSVTVHEWVWAPL